MKFNPYNILHDAAIGAALGGGGQYAYNSYNKNTDGFPVLGAAAGAGAGALTGLYLNKYKSKQQNVTSINQLKPGLYYMERGLFGDTNLFKGTDFHKYARHGFFLGVYNEKPVGIDTDRLPNGQYVVTFGSYPKTNEFGIPEELYFAVNGKNPSAGIDEPADLRAVKSLFDTDAQKYTDYAASIKPIDLDPESSKKSIEKLYNTTKKYENANLGTYNLLDNNCISGGAELARAAGIDMDKLPEHLGGLCGVYSKDIPRLQNHISMEPPKKKSLFDFGWLKSSEFAPAYSKKAKLEKAAKYILRSRMAKQAKTELSPDWEKSPEMLSKVIDNLDTYEEDWAPTKRNIGGRAYLDFIARHPDIAKKERFVPMHEYDPKYPEMGRGGWGFKQRFQPYLQDQLDILTNTVANKPVNELTPKELAVLTEFMDAADTGKDPNDTWINFTPRERKRILNSGLQGLKDLYDQYGYDYTMDLQLDDDTDWDRVERAEKALEKLYKQRFGKLS